MPLKGSFKGSFRVVSFKGFFKGPIIEAPFRFLYWSEFGVAPVEHLAKVVLAEAAAPEPAALL